MCLNPLHNEGEGGTETLMDVAAHCRNRKDCGRPQANIATFVLDLVHAAVQTNGLAKVFHAEEGLAVQWL